MRATTWRATTPQGDDAVRRCGHDDRCGIRRVRRTRGAWHITHIRAVVGRGLPRRRGAFPARQAPASQAAAEPAFRRSPVPRRPGRGPGRIPRLRGGQLAGDRGGDAHPGHADQRGRTVRGPPARARRSAAAPRTARCRRVRRAVPVPGPVQLPLRRLPDRRGRSAPGLHGHRDGAARGPPEVVWRAGLDLNPLDVTNPVDLAWLEALIWPEHAHRRARLRAAAALAAAEPPLLVRGDLVDDLPALAAQAPAEATLVVFHTSVLYQVPPPRRDAFASSVRTLPGHWIANEEPDVLTYTRCPRRPTGPCATCSRWTGYRSPGPGHTGKPSPGSGNTRICTLPHAGSAPPASHNHTPRGLGAASGTWFGGRCAPSR